MLVVRWLPLRGVGAVLQDMQESVPYRRHSIGGAETTRPSLSGRSALCMRAAEEEKKVHLGSPWNAALTFKKKYRSSRKP